MLKQKVLSWSTRSMLLIVSTAKLHFLINIKHLRPALSKVLSNTYREHIQLFIDGESIPSLEGTTQGDPLAMAMYAVAITPLIHRLAEENLKQVWFADDASAGERPAEIMMGHMAKV